MANIKIPERPAFLQARVRTDDFASFRSGLAVSNQPPRISIRDNRFTIIDKDGTKTPVNSLTLQVIVLTSNPSQSRIYYEGKYDPQGDGDAPTCISDDGQVPSAEAAKPQSRTCATCKQSEWGSAVSAMTGKGKPACTSYKRVAVYIPGHTEEAYLLGLPPMSSVPWREYIDFLEKDVQAFPDEVVTEVSFKSQGVLQFKALGYIKEEAEFVLTQTLKDSDEVRKLLGLDSRPAMPVEDAPPFEAPKPAAEPTRFERAPQAYSPPAGAPSAESLKEKLMADLKARRG